MNLTLMTRHGAAFAGALNGSVQWLLPWVGTLALSGALAFAAEQALVRGVIDQPALAGMVAAPGPETLSAMTSSVAPTDGNYRWVLLSAVDAQGTSTRLTCLIAANRVAADALDLSREDMERLVPDLSCYPRP
jgi:hypothetical protein